MYGSWLLAKSIKDQLSEFGDIEVKKMFGGAGLFHQSLMFGKIASETFQLKVDDHNEEDYKERGIKPFDSERHALLGSPARCY